MKIYFSLRILKYFTYKNKEINKYLPMTFMGPITNLVIIIWNHKNQNFSKITLKPKIGLGDI